MTKQEYIEKCLELFKEVEDYSQVEFLNIHSSLVLSTLELMVIKGTKEERDKIYNDFMDNMARELSEIAS